MDFLLVGTNERIPSVRVDASRKFRRPQHLFSLIFELCRKSAYIVTDFKALSA